MIYPDSRILEILRDQQLITDDTRELVRRFKEKWQVDDYDAVIQTNIFSADELSKHLSDATGMRCVDSIFKINSNQSDCLETIQFSDALKWNCFPVEIVPEEEFNKSSLKVVISDPTSKTLISEIEKSNSLRVDYFLGSRLEIRDAIFSNYPLAQQLPKICSSAEVI